MPLRNKVSLRGSLLLPVLLVNVIFNSWGGPQLERKATAAVISASEQDALDSADADAINAEIDIFSGLFSEFSSPQDIARASALWESKEVRGIYMSRYQITNRANEQTIRRRVRYYKQQGINTIIHGVWGNGCTMYPSAVMSKTFGMRSCPNEFQDQWLDWLLDEAHAQGMQVHAYFEKGIKLDRNSPIFDIAVANNWFVPGVDRTYAGIDHYVLDVQNPQVSSFFENVLTEFVSRYPTIDAVQWDDYVGYHEELPGEKEKDRTAALTGFMRSLRDAVKQNNPNVSFDVCHHNPYWGKRYFDADWANWNVDRAFIQVYNDDNFAEEMGYVRQHEGIAIADNQFNRLSELASNPNVKSVLLFPSEGNPEETAAKFKAHWSG